MSEVISCNIILKVGGIYIAADHKTYIEAKFKVIREATEEEYLKEHPHQNTLGKKYYEVSFD